MIRSASLLTAVLMAVVSMGLIGCAQDKPSTQAYRITIVADDSLRVDGQLPSIDVDIVGPSQADAPIYAAMGVSQYFERGSRNQPFILQRPFSRSRPGPFVIDMNDPIWRQWLDVSRARTLYVFVRNNALPPPRSEAEDNLWRRPIPLEKTAFQTSALRVVIHKDKVSVMEDAPAR